jgi:hypothetical protein
VGITQRHIPEDDILHTSTVLSSIISFGITESSIPTSFVSEAKMSVLFLNSNKE